MTRTGIVRGGLSHRHSGVCMLDLAGIMFSSIMMMIVIMRAVRLDRTLPWFQAVKRKATVVAKQDSPWRRQS